MIWVYLAAGCYFISQYTIHYRLTELEKRMFNQETKE